MLAHGPALSRGESLESPLWRGGDRSLERWGVSVPPAVLILPSIYLLIRAPFVIEGMALIGSAPAASPAETKAQPARLRERRSRCGVGIRTANGAPAPRRTARSGEAGPGPCQRTPTPRCPGETGPHAPEPVPSPRTRPLPTGATTNSGVPAPERPSSTEGRRSRLPREAGPRRPWIRKSKSGQDKSVI